MKIKYKILLVICIVGIITTSSTSYLLKRYITKNSIELVGNRIEINHLRFNPLTFAITISDARIYETNNIDIIATIDDLYVDFSPLKLKNNEYSASNISISGLKLNINQYDNRFNFEDAFEPLRKRNDTVPAKPLQYSLYNIEISKSQILFSDKNTNKEIAFKNINFQLPELAWNNAQSNMGLDLELGDKGKLFIDAKLDDRKKIYTVNCKVNDFDLNSLEDYASDYYNIRKLYGSLDFNYSIKGSLSDISDIKISGNTVVHNLSVYDDREIELVKVKRIDADVYYYKPTKSSLYIKTIKLTEANTELIIDEESNNWSRFLAPKHKYESQSESKLNYMIRKINIENGSLLYIDNRITPTANTDIFNINASISNISNESQEITAHYVGSLRSGGSIKGSAKLSSNKANNWQIDAKLTDLPLVNYSNFSDHYLSRPVLNGFLNYDFNLKVSKNHITNNNQLTFSNIVFGDKQKNETAYKVPVRSAYNLLKDRNNTVRINIPIEGDRDNEGFSLTNEIRIAFIEYLKSAGKTKAKNVGKSIKELTQDAEVIRLNYGKAKIPFKQEVILSKAADKVKSGEVKKLIFVPVTNSYLDNEQLAFQEVKVLYIKSKKRSKSINDKVLQIKLKLLSDNKPALIKYINAESSLNHNESVYTKCIDIIGSDKANALQEELLQKRRDELVKHLTNKLKLQPKSFEIKSTKQSNELSSPIYQLKEVSAGSGVNVEFEADF